MYLRYANVAFVLINFKVQQCGYTVSVDWAACHMTNKIILFHTV